MGQKKKQIFRRIFSYEQQQQNSHNNNTVQFSDDFWSSLIQFLFCINQIKG